MLIDQYLGGSSRGNTRQKYQHYYADDSFEAMLAIVDGIVTPNASAKNKARNLFKLEICTNCDESNKPDSKFCSKCKFVLTFDAFHEAVEEREKAAEDAEEQ